MTTPAIITHAIPDRIVALPDEVHERTRELLGYAGGISDITNADEFRAADALCAELQRHEKAIETARVAVKAPVLDLGRAIDAACKDALAPLGEARKAVGRAVMDWQRKERERLDAERREAERLARIEAEKRAAEERARLEAERAERQAREAEAAALFGDPEPVKDERPIAVRPVEVSLPAVQAPRAQSVQVRKVKRLRIIDAETIPVHLGPYLVREINESVLTMALREGHLCEGAELVEVEDVVGRGTR